MYFFNLFVKNIGIAEKINRFLKPEPVYFRKLLADSIPDNSLRNQSSFIPFSSAFIMISSGQMLD